VSRGRDLWHYEGSVGLLRLATMLAKCPTCKEWFEADELLSGNRCPQDLTVLERPPRREPTVLPVLHHYWVFLRRHEKGIYVDNHAAPSLEQAVAWAQSAERNRQGTDVMPEVLAVLDSENVVWGDVAGIPSGMLPAGHPVTRQLHDEYVRGKARGLAKAAFTTADFDQALSLTTDPEVIRYIKKMRRDAGLAD
jgi:hypothetical protein